MADGPLRGVRVLDLTHVWAGPLAVRTLADLGADVVKIEAPYGRGPRHFADLPIGGFLGGEPLEEPWNRNAVFVKLMRNRQSLCIDLKTDPGRDAFLALVAMADVVIENFSARAMVSLGLGYETLSAANPGIIYVAMPGYGSSGPYRDRVAFGPTVEPLSGLTNVLGYGPGEPRCTSLALMDPIAALSAASAVLTALRRRAATGLGTRVELSLHEGGVSFSGPWLIDHQLGRPAGPLGNRHPAMAPHGVYRCAGSDNWVAIGCADDHQWRRLCSLLGTSATAGLDPGSDLPARMAAHDEIDRAIEAFTSQRNKTEVAAMLRAAGIPAGAVNTTPDMLSDPQVLERGFFVPLEDRTPVPGTPIKMAGISSTDWTPCPKLGADNRAVLSGWLGYDDDRINELAERGVIVDRPPG